MSAKSTEELIFGGSITPTRLWLDDAIEEFIRREQCPHSIKYYKYYQVDAVENKASLVHNYQLYADVTNNSTAVEFIRLLTLDGTWKNIVANILSETIQAYHKGYINSEDIDLIKKILNCNIERPLKGPYNEYVVRYLSVIHPLILNGTRKRVGERIKKLKSFIEYFTIGRKKSFDYLLRSMPMDHVKRLYHLASIIDSLSSLVEMLRDGSTPIGHITFVEVIII